MCGIVGYISNNKTAIKETIDILKKLEYRGYDSSGIAYFDGNEIYIKKSKGRINELIKKIDLNKQANCAIAHTRWATHGEPNENNAHPHFGKNVIIVQNGIIENFNELKIFLVSQGYDFYSDTDTEVIAKLLDYEYSKNHDPLVAIRKSIEQIKGSYAMLIMFRDIKDKLFSINNDAPLVIAKGDDKFVVSSDVNSIAEYNNKFWFLNNNELAVIEKNSVSFYDKYNNPIEKKTKDVLIDFKTNDKNGFSTFMMKEIYEQIDLLQKCLNNYLNSENEIVFNIKGLNLDELSKYNKIRIIGCGSSYNIGLNAKYFFEEFSNIQTEAVIASEFRYSKYFNTPKTLNIVISQSGETADTLACVKLLKQNNEKILAITNNVNSSIANESDYVINMNCGVEYAVASTKTYMITTFILNLLAIKLGQINHSSNLKSIDIANQAYSSIYKCHEILDNEDVKKLAKDISKFKNIFFIGRVFDYSLCCEAALKLKEISYLNCNSYPSGELKHGPISLIDENTLTFVIISKNTPLSEKIYSNIKEILARKGIVIAIANRTIKPYLKDEKYFINNYADDNIFSYLSSILIFQLIAYYIAEYLGNDVDNPRNLAKSVTVE